MVRSNSIAIIPARGGSKRIPRKNVVEFHGKPLIAWTIEAALESALFKRVVVSTDDGEIAEVARRYGADVPFMRARHHDDHSPVSLATMHAIDQTAEHFQEEYDIVVQLMPNCPLREASHIVEAHDHFIRSKSEYQISCFKFGWMNPWWAVKLGPDNQPEPLIPASLESRSQDLPHLYCPTGAIWIARLGALKASETFYGPGHRFFPIDWKAAVDIDDHEDLAMADAVFRMRSGTCE